MVRAMSVAMVVLMDGDSRFTPAINGGYILRDTIEDFDDALACANKILTEEQEPKYPTWERGELPDPYKFDSNDIHYTIQKYPNDAGVVAGDQDCHHICIEALVLYVTVHGIVGIGGDCEVSLRAAAEPGNDCWYLISCHGTGSSFMIATDGEMYYPINKTKKKDRKIYKIALDQTVKSTDLSRMNSRDKKNINMAIKAYTKAVHTKDD